MIPFFVTLEKSPGVLGRFKGFYVGRIGSHYRDKDSFELGQFLSICNHAS